MTLGSGERPIEILIVEDNPGDAKLTQDTVNESNFESHITLAEDGEVAMARLLKEGEYSDSPTPDLILLDLQLPGKGGIEVLAEMFENDNLRSIPVFVLTGTEAERSILSPYKVPPNRFSKKPLDVRRLDAIISELRVFSKQPIEIPGKTQGTDESTGAKKSGGGPSARLD